MTDELVWEVEVLGTEILSVGPAACCSRLSGF